MTPRWGMVVDLNRCVGCQTCTIACKHANDTPPGVQWRRVLDVERGSFPNVERLFLVVGCQHCAEPPCVPVCPTGATRQRADGLVTMDYDTCIGCGYCAVACPYQARTIGHDKSWYYGAPTPQEEAVYPEEREGVAHKCTFCVERIDEAMELGKTPGRDLDYTPACAASCIASAIHFGDFADPDSNVSRLAEENSWFQMHAGLGTDPQIKYLYEVPQTTPGRAALADETEEAALSDPENPLVGERQTFWDIRAALNFTLGGMGSGLAVAAWLAQRLGGLDTSGLAALSAAAGVLMAAGLFSVFLEIGRKRRFLYVLRRPQSSWMTRETYAVAVFYPALAAALLWPHPALAALVAAAAAAFLVCQARILYAAKGIPAWRAPLIPWMLVASGLLEGVGVMAIAPAASLGHIAVGRIVPAAGVLLALVNGGLWIAYHSRARANAIPPLARRTLDAVSPYLVLLGHVLPTIVFLIGAALGPFALYSLAVAGLAAVAGGVLWKIAVITRAGHQQGFEIPNLPQRGSGSRAAPARLNPALARPQSPA